MARDVEERNTNLASAAPRVCKVCSANAARLSSVAPLDEERLERGRDSMGGLASASTGLQASSPTLRFEWSLLCLELLFLFLNRRKQSQAGIFLNVKPFTAFKNLPITRPIAVTN